MVAFINIFILILVFFISGLIYKYCIYFHLYLQKKWPNFDSSYKASDVTNRIKVISIFIFICTIPIFLTQ